MSQKSSTRTRRSFVCSDELWVRYEELSAELDCSVDYLVSEAMRIYALSRAPGAGDAQPPVVQPAVRGNLVSTRPNGLAGQPGSAPPQAADASPGRYSVRPAAQASSLPPPSIPSAPPPATRSTLKNVHALGALAASPIVVSPGPSSASRFPTQTASSLPARAPTTVGLPPPSTHPARPLSGAPAASSSALPPRPGAPSPGQDAFNGGVAPSHRAGGSPPPAAYPPQAQPGAAYPPQAQPPGAVYPPQAQPGAAYPPQAQPPGAGYPPAQAPGSAYPPPGQPPGWAYPPASPPIPGVYRAGGSPPPPAPGGDPSVWQPPGASRPQRGDATSILEGDADGRRVSPHIPRAPAVPAEAVFDRAHKPDSSPPPRAPGGKSILYVVFNGQKIPVSHDEFVIGRSRRTADLPIRDNNVSRRHATVVYEAGAHYIVDAGSTNGILVGEERVTRRRIQHGDVYTICGYELRFVYH